jgi:hypothetical protein
LVACPENPNFPVPANVVYRKHVLSHSKPAMGKQNVYVPELKAFLIHSNFLFVLHLMELTMCGLLSDFFQG